MDLLLPVAPVHPTTYANTIAVSPGTVFYDNIQRITGKPNINKFINIVLFPRMFQLKYDTFRDIQGGWRVNQLRTSRYQIQDWRNAPGTIHIMHELIHSTTNPNPILDHVKISAKLFEKQRDANGWEDITRAATRAIDGSMTRNPSTLAWLAFRTLCQIHPPTTLPTLIHQPLTNSIALVLSMPWVKWWDGKALGNLNGFPRPNEFPIMHNGIPAGLKTFIPLALEPDPNLRNNRIYLESQTANGPYSFL
ncbi:hypothetical protein GP486_003656 [Trichoglossum hirsutum]|uniref:Uncharacterized protein n=1 Tax=Trichoglossum hirsutum TaxID=265104 RepID=A0A9P8LCQ1_9PEZI|nr:hypothetical protein GP486_003656 [Trichoglossum hirsutum]